MERLGKRLDIASKALATLDEVSSLGLPPKAERDISIMRFVYTFEALWRALQRYLLVVGGIEVRVPKECMRAARNAELISDGRTETALSMVDDRNLTVHTYNEDLANQIFDRLPDYISVMRSLLRAMVERAKER